MAFLSVTGKDSLKYAPQKEVDETIALYHERLKLWFRFVTVCDGTAKSLEDTIDRNIEETLEDFRTRAIQAYRDRIKMVLNAKAKRVNHE